MEQAQARDYFLNLTPGKLMGLKQITDASGKFKVLALDQYSSFDKAFSDDTRKKQEAKLALTRIVGAHSSSTLLDVVISARQAINSGALAKGVGLIVRLEKGCSAGDYGYEETGFSVAKLKRMGASAVKLLVYLDVQRDSKGELDKYTKAQIEFVKRTYEASCEHDILLMTEELSFPRPGGEEKGDKNSPHFLERRARNIIESTKLIGPYTDVLKLEYPGDEHLADLDRAAIRPWVLLSAGAKFNDFRKRVEAAMKAGASGIMAGRAIFQEWLDRDSPQTFQKPEFLTEVAVTRLQELNDLVDQYATSWQSRFQIADADLAGVVEQNWYSRRAVSVTTGY